MPSLDTTCTTDCHLKLCKCSPLTTRFCSPTTRRISTPGVHNTTRMIIHMGPGAAWRGARFMGLPARKGTPARQLLIERARRRIRATPRQCLGLARMRRINLSGKTFTARADSMSCGSQRCPSCLQSLPCFLYLSTLRGERQPPRFWTSALVFGDHVMPAVVRQATVAHGGRAHAQAGEVQRGSGEREVHLVLPQRLIEHPGVGGHGVKVR